MPITFRVEKEKIKEIAEIENVVSWGNDNYCIED